MRIIVISDTHSRAMPPSLIEDFKKADLIIHAGDFCCLDDVKFFQRLNKLEAVHGNVDSAEIRVQLPAKKIIMVEDVRIGLCHGDGKPDKVLGYVQDLFRHEDVDMVIFGHSHLPCHETIKDVVYFNPGSLTDKVRPPFCSYGVLEIKGNSITANIVKVEENI
ncbi:MAG TPA: metallophosphoesterase [Candidatus Omnitrophota bacterium]|nr:metallophosphoesterase [Candidatus Omnitrophota bacterium]